MRLHRVQKKKRESLARQWAQAKQRIVKTMRKEEERNAEVAKGKKITDLNTNAMSVLLPYLEHSEIQRLEGCNLKMSVLADSWPVWKNIYSEQHKKNRNIPKEVSDMTN